MPWNPKQKYRSKLSYRRILHPVVATLSVSQLVLQALIQATVEGRDDIDGRFMSAQIAAHPLYRRGEP